MNLRNPLLLLMAFYSQLAIAEPQKVAKEALDLLQVDPLGLDDVDRRVLRTIIEKYGGGPVGLNTIARLFPTWKPDPRSFAGKATLAAPGAITGSLKLA